VGALANLLSRLLAVLALNRMKGRVKLLKESLALLASEPDVQLAHLRDLGVPDHVDELALEHDDIAPTAEKMLREGEINEDQLNCIKELDAILKGMSGNSNAHLWTAESLNNAQEWRYVRRFAKQCFNKLA